MAVKILAQFTLIFWGWAFTLMPAAAAFSSLYVFGDGACTTTNYLNTGSSLYYGLRSSNGRVWVEVLAQRQGLTYIASNNWSYYGQTSSILVTNAASFKAPANATNALFAVWTCDADFVYDLQNAVLGPPYDASKLPLWTNVINLHLTNHFKALTNLYAKGLRNLVAPSATDLTQIPVFNGLFYNSPSAQAFVRERILSFNSGYLALLNNLKASRPNLNFWAPDLFHLLNDVEAHASQYGLTNALAAGVVSDVLDTASLSPWSLNGPGTNYIFWDSDDPTAKFHEVIADFIQQQISPPTLVGISPGAAKILLRLSNPPLGLSGFVEGKTDLATTNWGMELGFNSTNLSQTISVPAGAPPHFYRVRFPFAWAWP
jgi:phospholipase/lecithinase/hemolysin